MCYCNLTIKYFDKVVSVLNSSFANPLLLTLIVPSAPLFADSISLNTKAENGNISLCSVNVAGSVNLTLLACVERSPNSISTTFSLCAVVVVLIVNCRCFF
jgi:hypothetical protein